MSQIESRKSKRMPCEACPLRSCGHFRDFTPAELDFISSFKMGELAADAGATILVEGASSAHLYTALSGFGFRYKVLEDGRRQILNYFFPGDLVGLQGALMAEMQHSVEALTPVALCVFERERLHDLYRRHPGLAYDMTWMASREERFLDEHLLSVGRRSAVERAAYLLAFLATRSQATGFASKQTRHLPITQNHVADTLGLSIVHTNRTLKKLGARGLIRWLERGVEILDVDGLKDLSGWTVDPTYRRPFL